MPDTPQNEYSRKWTDRFLGVARAILKGRGGLCYYRYLCFSLLKRIFIFVLAQVISIAGKIQKGIPWDGKSIVLVLPAPLGIGDISMLSPMLARLSGFELRCFSTHTKILDSAATWQSFSSSDQLFAACGTAGSKGNLILLPKLSIRSLLFAARHLGLPMLLETGEGRAYNSMLRRSYSLQAAGSYRVAALKLLDQICPTPENEVDYYKWQRAPFVARPLETSLDIPGLQISRKHKLVLLAPFANWESRRWNAKSWRKLALGLAEREDIQLAVIGGPGEQEYISNLLFDEDLQHIERKAIDLTGRLELSEVFWLLQRAALLVTVDNGLLHLGLTARVPVVALFGPTPFWGRVDGHERVTALHCYDSCHLAPCYNSLREVVCPYDTQCVRDISASEVLKSCLSTIYDPPDGASPFVG